MGRLLRRLALVAVLGGVSAAIARRVLNRNECSPTCDCSLGATSCTCGHTTCLAPAVAA